MTINLKLVIPAVLVLMATAHPAHAAISCADLYAAWDEQQASAAAVELLDASMNAGAGTQIVNPADRLSGGVVCAEDGLATRLVIGPDPEALGADGALAYEAFVRAAATLWSIMARSDVTVDFDATIRGLLDDYGKLKDGGTTEPFVTTALGDYSEEYLFVISFGYLQQRWAGLTIMIEAR